MTSTIRSVVSCLLMLSASGCATAGTATGELVENDGTEEPVSFEWHSEMDEPTEGSISTVLPDGRAFEGRYFEVTQTVEADTLAPLWVNWNPYWSDWSAPWGTSVVSNGFDSFARIYSGHVVATLSNPGGRNMRCRFTLSEPSRGMSEGGVGDCQLDDGEKIEDVVLQ